MRVLLDTNVVLDVLLAREPFVHDAAELMGLIEQERIHGYLCATTVTTIAYLLEKASDASRSREAIGDLLKVFGIAEVDHVVLNSALNSSIDDFEDAVLHESAILTDLDAIITRNVRDFTSASLPVYLPKTFLAAHNADAAQR